MNFHDVKDPGSALAYITDCNLATVEAMAMKRTRAMIEFERQKAIAQKAIDWMVDMGVDFSTTRAADVVKAGGIDAWVKPLFWKKDEESNSPFSPDSSK